MKAPSWGALTTTAVSDKKPEETAVDREVKDPVSSGALLYNSTRDQPFATVTEVLMSSAIPETIREAVQDIDQTARLAGMVVRERLGLEPGTQAFARATLELARSLETAIWRRTIERQS